MSGERVTTEAMLDAALEQLAAADRWRQIVYQVFDRHTFFGDPLNAFGGWVWGYLALVDTPDEKLTVLQAFESQGDALRKAGGAFQRWLGGRAPDRPSCDLGAAALAVAGAAATTVADGEHRVALDEAEARALVDDLLTQALMDKTLRVRVSSWPSGQHERGWVWIRVGGTPSESGGHLRVGPHGIAGAGGGLLHHDPGGPYVAECWLPKVIRR